MAELVYVLASGASEALPHEGSSPFLSTNLDKHRQICKHHIIRGSSSGRTTGFGSVNRGSIPCPRTINITHLKGGLFVIILSLTIRIYSANMRP